MGTVEEGEVLVEETSGHTGCTSQADRLVGMTCMRCCARSSICHQPRFQLFHLQCQVQRHRRCEGRVTAFITGKWQFPIELQLRDTRHTQLKGSWARKENVGGRRLEEVKGTSSAGTRSGLERRIRSECYSEKATREIK